jgi:phosphopantothenoylcysteine synthetase/decarboxylase
MLTDGPLIWGFRNLLTVDTFVDFDEYAHKLQSHLENDKPNVTMLAAAVSDYGMPATGGKISSDKDEVTFTMTRLPKLIAKVKEWCPTTYLVGFKLLVDSTLATRTEAVAKQIATAGSDLVVVNDLRDIKKGEHILWCHSHPGSVTVFKIGNLAAQLVAGIDRRSV